jgi:hypothetical protein
LQLGLLQLPLRLPLHFLFLSACTDCRGGAASARVDKSLLIFTNNPDPLSDAGSNIPHLR